MSVKTNTKGDSSMKKLDIANYFIAGSAAIFYSAWHLKLTFLTANWALYCLAWIPLIAIIVAAYKFDREMKKRGYPFRNQSFS